MASGTGAGPFLHLVPLPEGERGSCGHIIKAVLRGNGRAVKSLELTEGSRAAGEAKPCARPYRRAQGKENQVQAGSGYWTRKAR